LEQLSKDKGITAQDCKNLFAYAKVQYEMQKYKDAERWLFNLKEILASEVNTHTEFVMQVFWGLLSCEILNRKSRELIELTTLRKLKEFIRSKLSDDVMASHQSYSWLLHMVLVYTFTQDKKDNQSGIYNGLFSTLLADRSNFG